MKKRLTLLFFAIAVALSAWYNSANACTNLMVTRGASKTGSTMVSYTADSHTLYGALYFLPAADHAPGTMRTVREWDTGKILGEIPEVAHTYSVIGNINEHQLLIGESTFGGRGGLHDPNAIIDYGSLIYITLQRCKTARQAVEYMGWLVAEYGYYSSGESMSIADPNEVWYLEIIGKGEGNKGAAWVALKVPDGMISAHANQARITTFPLNDPANCLYAKDVITFARSKGWFNGADKDFDFSAAYAPVSASSARSCDARVWSIFRRAADGMDKYENYAMGNDLSQRMPLWVKPNRKLDLKDAAELMRDHYQGTRLDMSKGAGAGGHEVPYRWRPMGFEVDGQEYINERAISTQQTGWWYVGECRSWLPDPVGGVLWFGTDDSALSPLTPIYCGTTRVPWCLSEQNGAMTEYSPTSMFWIQQRVSNFAYLRYNHIFPDVKRAMDRFEFKCLEQHKAIDTQAAALYKESPELAREFVTQYTVDTAWELFNTWQKLDQYLLVKFIDGNTKKESSEGVFIDNGNNHKIPVGPTQPGYSEAWKRAAAGDDWSENIRVKK